MSLFTLTLESSRYSTGLKDCLELIRKGSIIINEDNYKAIFKFGKVFQIHEMMEGVLVWITNDVTYDKLWNIYLDPNNLHEDINKSKFVTATERCLRSDRDKFVKLTKLLCRSLHETALTAVVELLSGINDVGVLSVIELLVDKATKSAETLGATPSSTDNNSYLQAVASSTVTYVENFLKSSSCDESHKSRCKQTLHKVSNVCTNIETSQRINRILFAAPSIKDLNWETVKQLTSPKTPYDAIKSFTDNAGTGVHPCVVAEIVLKWWRVRTSKEDVDMSFMKPLIETIQSVSSKWYEGVCKDNRYEGLMKTLNIPTPTAEHDIYYSTWGNDNNKLVLKNCINGKSARLERLKCTKNMQRYEQSVPDFTYNDTAFPPFGDTKHHWYISKYLAKHSDHVSFITNSKNELLDYINDGAIYICFIPLPDSYTLQQ